MKNFNNGMRQRKTPWESFRWSIALGFLPPPVFTPMEGKERISYAYNKKITKTFCLPRFWRKMPNKCFLSVYSIQSVHYCFLVSWDWRRRRKRMNCLLINELHALQSLVFLLSLSLSLTHTHLLTYLHNHEQVVKGPTLTGFFRSAKEIYTLSRKTTLLKM